MFKIKSKTEKFLLALTIVLFLALIVSVFSKKPADVRVLSAEDETSGSETSGSSESENNGDDDSENNGDDESENNGDSESSDDGEDSEESVGNIAPRTYSAPTQETSGSSESSDNTSALETELSEESSASKITQETSENSEKSVASIRSIAGYDEVVEIDGKTAIVKKNKKLFYLFPVEIESQVTLDEQGNVVDKKQSIWNWFLSLFSA